MDFLKNHYTVVKERCEDNDVSFFNCDTGIKNIISGQYDQYDIESVCEAVNNCRFVLDDEVLTEQTLLEEIFSLEEGDKWWESTSTFEPLSNKQIINNMLGR